MDLVDQLSVRHRFSYKMNHNGVLVLGSRLWIGGGTTPCDLEFDQFFVFFKSLQFWFTTYLPTDYGGPGGPTECDP